MSAASEYVSPAEDWYRGQYRQQQERYEDCCARTQNWIARVDYSRKEYTPRPVFQQQYNYIHYVQEPLATQTRYSTSLSSYSHLAQFDVPQPIDPPQQYIERAPRQSYPPPPPVRHEPSPYSSQRIFQQDAYFSPSQYSPGSSAPSTPYLYGSPSQAKSFQHQQIARHEGIRRIRFREYCKEEEEYDESPPSSPLPHDNDDAMSYERKIPFPQRPHEPTIEEGYFPYMDADAEGSDCSRSPSPPPPNYVPERRPTLPTLAHRHIYEDPAVDYHPSLPSSPSPGPLSSLVPDVVNIVKQDYPSPIDENRFRIAPPALQSPTPPSPLTSLVDEEEAAPCEEGESDEEESFQVDLDEEMEEEEISRAPFVAQDCFAPKSSKEEVPRIRELRAVTQSTESPEKTMEFEQNVPAFVMKLVFLLRNPESYGGAIFWNRAGDRFSFAPKSDQFAEEILPEFYNHRNASAFQRQLNVYGFKRATHTMLSLQDVEDNVPALGFPYGAYVSYSHPVFRRIANDFRLAELRPKPSRARKDKQNEKQRLFIAREKAIAARTAKIRAAKRK